MAARLNRRVCDANIVITGATHESAAAGAFLRAELTGVRYTRFPDGADAAIEAELANADMLVFVADADDAVDAARIERIARLARGRGILVAAFVRSETSHPQHSALLAALRGAADTVVMVNDRSDLHAAVAALR